MRFQPAATCGPLSGRSAFIASFVNGGKSESDLKQAFGGLLDLACLHVATSPSARCCDEKIRAHPDCRATAKIHRRATSNRTGGHAAGTPISRGAVAGCAGADHVTANSFSITAYAGFDLDQWPPSRRNIFCALTRVFPPVRPLP